MSAHQVTHINSYADAIAAGNALLCLPLEIRQEIFAFAAPHGRSEAANMLQGRRCEWLPPMCHVNDDFFVESLPMFLRHRTLVVRKSSSAYNLRYFLLATNTLASIYKLRFTTAEAFTPLSAGAWLLSNCINLRDVWLSFRRCDFNVLPSATATNNHLNRTLKKIDMKAFAESYPFRQLLSLRYLERVTLFLINDGLLPDGASDLLVHIKRWLKRKFEWRKFSLVEIVYCSFTSDFDIADYA
jgi:hypothetical protein